MSKASRQKNKWSANVYFEDKPEKLSKLDWQNKKHKYKYITFAEKD